MAGRLFSPLALATILQRAQIALRAKSNCEPRADGRLSLAFRNSIGYIGFGAFVVLLKFMEITMLIAPPPAL